MQCTIPLVLGTKTVRYCNWAYRYILPHIPHSSFVTLNGLVMTLGLQFCNLVDNENVGSAGCCCLAHTLTVMRQQVVLVAP